MAKTTDSEIVELSSSDGVAFIGQSSPLTRLHYFDGQYLRASSFTTEQDYHRHALQLANLAGGWGVVHGLGVSLAGGQLRVSAGLAITPAGQLVLTESDVGAALSELLDSATPAPDVQPGQAGKSDKSGRPGFGDCLEKSTTGVAATAGLQVYEITVGPVEGLCGNEPVYGKLCDTACATESRRPYWREGLMLRLRPIALALPDSSSVTALAAHLRNRLASGYFAREPGQPASALSAAGLAGGVWCQPAQLYGREEVAIGLLWREAGVARLDAWSARRERMDAQARGYWQGRMAMRPWNVFTAQVLQFQCQLSGLFQPGSPVLEPEDDCDRIRDLLGRARQDIETLLQRYGASAREILSRAEGRPTAKEYQSVAAEMKASFAELDGLSTELAQAGLGQGSLPQKRLLLRGGFFELPPAGYLPVSTASDVQEQVARMMGEGVDLHFHAVRADEIAHLVEEAQHLQRISLTRGLDDPRQREAVEVFVPDGRVLDAQAQSPGTWWRMSLSGSALNAFSGLMRDEKRVVAEVGDNIRKASAEAEAAPQPKSGAKATTKASAKASTGAAAAAAAPSATTGSSGLLGALGLAQTPLDGLARTETREDGSLGVTLVGLAETVPTNPQVLAYLKQRGISVLRLGLYLAADIARDPFTLPIGGATAVEAELAMFILVNGTTMGVRGQLTVLAQRGLDSGAQQRLVQLDLQLAAIDNTAEDATGDPAAAPIKAGQASTALRRLRLVLERDSDGRTGFLVIDDEQRDPASSPLEFTWDDHPRRAALYVEAEKTEDTNVKPSAAAAAAAAAPAAPAASATAGSGIQQRQQLMSLSALPGMPDPASTVGAAAMNTLALLADGADDAALLMRGRRRLFPLLDAPRQTRIQARLDWLMFRRARTHLCAPACREQPALDVESFQVWHLPLESEKDLARLTKALDSGDAKALAAFRFRRVGLLRYRDESAWSEESPDQVLSMWQAAQPGRAVALGRVWEAAPTVGQGWQNHMRLRHMLEQIRSLTRPPARGDSRVAVMPPPPAPLEDKALDGGMLVVTLPGEVTRRQALMIWVRNEGSGFIISPDGPSSPLEFANDQPQGQALADFAAKVAQAGVANGVTLATPKAAPDLPNARTRLDSVVAALAQAGANVPASRQHVVALDTADRAALVRAGFKPDDYDDIVFFEEKGTTA